jgi:hypothetical protein
MVFVHFEGKDQRSLYCSQKVCLECVCCAKSGNTCLKCFPFIGLLLEIISFVLFIRELKKPDIQELKIHTQ